MRRLIVVLAVFLVAGWVWGEVSLRDCSRALDGLASEASESADLAAEAADRQEELEEARVSSEACAKEPEIYDVMQDGCTGRRDEWARAQREVDTAITELDAQIVRIPDALNAVRGSCNE